MDLDVDFLTEVEEPGQRDLARALDALTAAIRKRTVASTHVSAMFAAVPSALLQLNSAGQITATNATAHALYGSPVEGLCYREVLGDITADEDTPVPTLDEMCTPVRMLLLDSNGEERFLDLTVAPLFGHFGELQGYVASGTDVTADVRALQAMDQARHQAISDAAARSRFLATVSHEIRTPLNGIIGTASYLKTKQIPAFREELDLIHGCADHLLALINDVLDFSKIDEGGLSLVEQNFNLRHLLNKVVAIVRPRVAPQVKLEAALDGLQINTVLADPLRIRQIALNLLGNASKFTDVGHIHLSASTHSSEGAVHLVLEIEDTGAGISAEDQERIFHPYEQAKHGVTTSGGTGLGLAIVSHLAKAMKGRITVESELGRGSVFRVSLQLAHAIAPPQPKEAPTGRTLAPGVRVLLVDDNKVNRIVARRLLESQKCVVSEATGGEQAIRRVLDGPNDLDLVLMDCQMPGVDGLEATRQIREKIDADTLPIIAFTANAFEEERERCLRAGMNEFVTKPVKMDDLQTLLARFAPLALAP